MANDNHVYVLKISQELNQARALTRTLSFFPVKTLCPFVLSSILHIPERR